jgi:hypothetical protein
MSKGNSTTGLPVLQYTPITALVMGAVEAQTFQICPILAARHAKDRVETFPPGPLFTFFMALRFPDALW